jgi:predicted ABC-type ATPase
MGKKIIIIAGPNGAGKTTFARSFLPDEARCPHFINADLIAAGLSPFAPETMAIKAGRLMLSESRIVSVRVRVLPLKPLYPDSAMQTTLGNGKIWAIMSAYFFYPYQMSMSPWLVLLNV